jgi:hypothetical protein
VTGTASGLTLPPSDEAVKFFTGTPPQPDTRSSTFVTSCIIADFSTTPKQSPKIYFLFGLLLTEKVLQALFLQRS